MASALEAGVRSIEHGVFLTEAHAQAMAQRNCTLVPTLFIIHEVIRWAEAGNLPPYATEKALELRAHLGSAVVVAREYGVRSALGSDFVKRDQHGHHLTEMTMLHAAGLSAEETLLAATINEAELLGVADTRGRIEPGYFFDAVVLRADPTRDFWRMEQPEMIGAVFKDGCLAHIAWELVSEWQGLGAARLTPPPDVSPAPSDATKLD